MSREDARPVRAADEHAAEARLPSAVRISQSRGEDHRRPLPHGRRFVIATAALVGLAVTALAIAVAVAVGHHGTRRASLGSAAWSGWRPTDNGLAGAQEIADYVAPYYRATPSVQLAVVTVVNLNNPANPLQVVVPSSGSSGSLLPLPAGSTIVYNLCGVGAANCSIGVGKPSIARLLLLRREALELALYTFRYISAAQAVVAILPPGHTAACTGICAKPPAKPVLGPVDLAVAFDRPELQSYVSEPLRATLPEGFPPTVAQMPKASEALLVSAITAHGLFSEKTQQGQDGSTVITLSPMAPQ